MAEVFELHDRSRFEVFAYSLGQDDASPMRQRLVQAFAVFHDVRGKSLAQIDAQIRADDIDILVDLKGYTEQARPEIMALRPAPIQVNYLGYPGTLGGDGWDYIIADDIVLPAAHQADYSEKPVYMPWSYQCNDRQRSVADVPTRKMAGLPEQGVVLCCFNTSYKLTPAFFALWCEVLRAVPGSVLWILDGGEAVRENLTRYAHHQGVDAARLVFAPKLPHAQHLARLSLADLFLDTLPYNAHTTASDALWVGVPVVTCLGDTFAGRVAASLLRAVGLDELVADTPATYQAQLVRLAGDPQELARLREHLQRERLHSPLFDSESFTRDLEEAYQQMWARHQAGLPVEAFQLAGSSHAPLGESTVDAVAPKAVNVAGSFWRRLLGRG
jgi:predicted O-linked N-acetylglucosamine transferase (SPINDLY family)